MGNQKQSNVVEFHPPHRKKTDAWCDRSWEKLSSGLRIDRNLKHGSNATISEGLKADILALGQETQNAVEQFVQDDSDSGPMAEIADAMACMKDLANRVGALQQRLESTIRNVDMTAENLSAANSNLQDVDVAMETFSATSILTLQKTGRSLLAGGGVAPKVALSLLRS